MEYWRLVYDLPAVTAGTTIAAYLSPWGFRSRYAPLVMFLVGLLVLSAPEPVSLALALTIPAAWLQERVLGISIEGHEPVRVRLPQFRRPRVVLQEFAARAYPDPADPEDDDELPAVAAGAGTEKVMSFVPPV